MDKKELESKINSAILKSDKDKGAEVGKAIKYYQVETNDINKYSVDISIYYLFIINFFPEHVDELISFTNARDKNKPTFNIGKLKELLNDKSLSMELPKELSNNNLDEKTIKILQMFAQIVEGNNYSEIEDKEKLINIIYKNDSVETIYKNHYPVLTRKKINRNKPALLKNRNELIKKAKFMRSQNKTMIEIAEELKITRQTVSLLLREPD